MSNDASDSVFTPHQGICTFFSISLAHLSVSFLSLITDSALALVGDAALKCHVVVALRGAQPSAKSGLLDNLAVKYISNRSLALVATQLGLQVFFREMTSPSEHRLGTALEALIGHQQLQAPQEVAAIVARVMAAIDELPG